MMASFEAKAAAAGASASVLFVVKIMDLVVAREPSIFLPGKKGHDRPGGGDGGGGRGSVAGWQQREAGAEEGASTGKPAASM
jgi:hypothetical protein